MVGLAVVHLVVLLVVLLVLLVVLLLALHLVVRLLRLLPFRHRRHIRLVSHRRRVADLDFRHNLPGYRLLAE